MAGKSVSEKWNPFPEVERQQAAANKKKAAPAPKKKKKSYSWSDAIGGSLKYVGDYVRGVNSK